MTTASAEQIQQVRQLEREARFHKLESGRHRRRSVAARERRRILLEQMESVGIETKIFGVGELHHGHTKTTRP